MDIWAYNAALEHIGIIDDFDTAIFDWNYCDISMLSMLVDYTENSRMLLQLGHCLCRAPKNSAERVRLFVISHLQYRQTLQGSVSIEVKCCDLVEWLKHRIITKNIFGVTTLDKAFEAVFENAYREGKRTVDNLLLENTEKSLQIELGELHGKDVYTVFLSLCALASLGLRVETDIKEKKHYLRVQSGLDRTQNDAARYIISDVFDNILNPEYSINDEQRKNAAYCINEDKLYSYGDDAAAARREVMLNSSVSRSYTDKAGVQRNRTNAQMLELITQELKSNLEKHSRIEIFKCTVLPYDYQKMYDIGDLVLFEHREWGVSKPMRISGIKESWQAQQQKVELVLGDKQRSLLEQIKLMR